MRSARSAFLTNPHTHADSNKPCDCRCRIDIEFAGEIFLGGICLISEIREMFAVLAASAFVAPAHMQVQYAKPFSLNFLLSFLLCLSLLRSALPVQRCSLAQDGPCATSAGAGHSGDSQEQYAKPFARWSGMPRSCTHARSLAHYSVHCVPAEGQQEKLR